VLSPTPGLDGKIGVGPAVEHQAFGVFAALGAGFAEPPRVWVTAGKGVVQLLGGRDHAEVTSVVGIVSSTPRWGDRMRLLGALTSYYLFIPTLLALVFFPRRERTVPRKVPT
jgi:hypothetical protein